MHGDSGDKNNGYGVGDGGANINGGDDANWVDGENIVHCGEDKDAGGDGVVDANGGSDADFEDDKTKVDCSDDTADVDCNSNNDGGPNDGGGGDTNGNDSDWDDSDTDDDNNDVTDGDNDSDGNEANGGSNDEGGGGNDDDGDNADGDAKDGGSNDYDDKDDVEFKDDDGVRGGFFSNPISFAFPQFLMWIYHFLVQLDVINLWSITTCQVIGLYEPSCDLALNSICWFHLYRVF